MTQPSRFAPPTQLDALRTLLSGYAEGDRGFLPQYDRALRSLRQLALPLLGRRLARTTTPRSLRVLILESVQRFDWAEWDLHLMRMLQPEEDLGLFEAACGALGFLATRRAFEGLQRLKEVRRDAERQMVLERELEPFLSGHPFEIYLGALALGEENPLLARQGAKGVAARLTSSDLPTLLEAYRHGDALARRLVLHGVSFLPGAEAGTFLTELFQEARSELADARAMPTLLPSLKGLPREELKQKLLSGLEQSFAPRDPERITALRIALKDPAARAEEELEALRGAVRGTMESFLAKALGLILEGKAMGFSSLLVATAEGNAALSARCEALLDELGDHLAARVEAGLLPLETVLPMLEEACHAHAGREGVLVTYLRLVQPDDRARLDRILQEPDLDRRKRCVEVLGAREEDRLVPVFLRAMNDPAKEVGQLAIHQIGRLPSAFKTMMDLFRSEQVDRQREAIRFFSENRTKAAAKALMGFLASEGPDELLTDAAVALGRIQDPASATAMLLQLHAGKPLQMQLALVEALASLHTPAASLGLLKKSEELTFPQVLIRALEGSLAAFPGFDRPFPAEQVAVLENLARRCCDPREGDGQWIPTALTLQELYVFDQGLFERLSDGFQTFLSEMRIRTPRERELHDQVTEVVRKLARRAESLARAEERELALQAQMEAHATSTGQKRLATLYAMQEVLSDPWLVLGLPFQGILGAFLRRELAEEMNKEPKETQLLCELAALSRQSSLVEPLRDLFGRTAIPSLKAATRKALLALGLAENEIERRGPIKGILLLDPNAFFRKRLVTALEGQGRTIASAANRPEAEALLEKGPVDLLVTELQDEGGDLGAWLEAGWSQRRFRYVLLSTANHDLGGLGEKPWVIGRLYKPYPVEELLKAVEG